MALQSRSRIHQTYGKIRGIMCPPSSIKEGHLILANNHSKYKKEEKPMSAVITFTTGNYHCKPLMIDVIVIHNLPNGK